MTIEEIKNLGNIVFDQRDISPTQLGITSRKINYWLDHNLVPFVEKHQNVKDTEKKILVPNEITEKLQFLKDISEGALEKKNQRSLHILRILM